VKNIIVTGTARSYTSLTMQLLELMGVPLSFDQELNEGVNLRHNSNGLYELNRHVIDGIRTDKYDGTAIKLMLGALFPNSKNGHSGTPYQFVKDYNIVMCLRDPKEIAYSAYKINKLQGFTPQYPLLELGGFLMWLQDHRGLFKNITTVDTSLYFNDLEGALKRLSQATGVKYNPAMLSKARQKIFDKKVSPSNWNVEDDAIGQLLDNVYESLIANDFDKAINYITEVYCV